MLPSVGIDFIMLIRVFLFIKIVDTHDGAGKGGNFAEGDEDGFVDLSGGCDVCAAEEKGESSKSQNGGCDQLYQVLVHNALFLKSGAKVVQKNGTAKFWGSEL